MKKFLKAVLIAAMCVCFAVSAAACNDVELKISLDETSVTLEIGESKTISATVTPEGTEYTWSSDNEAVATVENGRVMAVAAGTTTIWAIVNDDVKASCSVTVKEPDISLDKTELSLKAGASATLTAIVTPAGTAVSWSSDNEDVATVENGKVTAVAKGVTTITAQIDENKKATCTVTVKEISLSETKLSLSVGESETLVATTYPADAAVAWSSNDEAVASVADGVVTALSSGEATITASLGDGIEAACTVTVNGLSLSVTEMTLALGEDADLTASVYPADSEISWTSDDETVVSVADGKITAQGLGTAKITAQANGLSASCTVEVVAFTADEFTPAVVYDTFTMDEVTGKFFKWNSSWAELSVQSDSLARLVAYCEENGFNALEVTGYTYIDNNGVIIQNADGAQVAYFGNRQWNTQIVEVSSFNSFYMQGVGDFYFSIEPVFDITVYFSDTVSLGTYEIGGKTGEFYRWQSSAYQPTLSLSEEGFTFLKAECEAAGCNELKISVYPILTNNGLVIRGESNNQIAWCGPNQWQEVIISVEDYSSFNFWSQSEGTTEVYFTMEPNIQTSE